MKVVYKYPVSLSVKFSFQIPQYAEVLSVGMQNGSPQMWVLLDPDARGIIRTFSIFGTGCEISHPNVEYVGTFQNGDLVWHLFELK